MIVFLFTLLILIVIFNRGGTIYNTPNEIDSIRGKGVQRNPPIGEMGRQVLTVELFHWGNLTPVPPMGKTSIGGTGVKSPQWSVN